jgi:hypothetical protein
MDAFDTRNSDMDAARLTQAVTTPPSFLGTIDVQRRSEEDYLGELGSLKCGMR